MKRIAIAVLLTTFIAFPAAAQKLNLDFPGLADRAEEVVDVTIDGEMLKVASKFLSKNDPEEANVGAMIRNLQGVYVRSYEFAKEGEYDLALIDKVKSQLGPSWKPFVTVRSKKKENVNIMADMRGDKVVGLVIIASEPKEFTVVNIVGPIDLDHLADLEGQFGIPKMTKE